MGESTTDLLDRKTAATHCGVTETYLANLAKSGGTGGPAFVKLSPRKTLYPRPDLDRWIASWVRIEPNKRMMDNIIVNSDADEGMDAFEKKAV